MNFRLTTNQLLFVIGTLLLVVLFGWNHVLELRAEEPRRAIVAMEMVLSGEYWVPQIHQWPYYNKPPLFNWWLAVFFQLFGSCAEWVVRLPALDAFLAMALLHYYLSSQFLKHTVALFSSLFLLTSADLLFYGTVNAGEIDLFYSAIVYVQVMAIFIYGQRKAFGWLFVVSYGMAALGTLSKGLPSIAFQGLTLIPWLMVIRQWRQLFSWHHLTGIMVYGAIVGGYLYGYGQYDEVTGFVVRQFSEATQKSGVTHPFWETVMQSAIFPFTLIKLFLPWSVLAVFFWRRDFWVVIRSNPFLLFSVIFILCNIPLYWITADFKSRYIYMFFPFIATLLSYFFFEATDQQGQWRTNVERGLGVVIGLSIVAYTALPFLPQLIGVKGLLVKSIAMILLVGLVFYYYQKQPIQRWYSLVVFVLVMRLGFNLFYLPAAAVQSDSMVYRNHVKEVLQITEKNPVHWAGEPYHFIARAAVGPYVLAEQMLTSAPLVAYQVPYYVTKGNGHIMRFDRVLEPDHYYLAHRQALPADSTTILYRFPDLWLGRELVLFKTD